MADIEKLVHELTLDEKASLTAGEDLWSTVAVDRLGIPKVLVTDGPNGARGPTVPGDANAGTSVCVPCGSALGATWDVDLVRRVGVLLGTETRRRGCRVLLAPTVNIHRSPLAGRNFECYSEDPLLSGRLAAAYIDGAQSQTVATTVKHFVGNDAEFERMSMSSVIDERTLREIYLLPFELAVREGGSLGIMTGYNRLNGMWCGEHDELFAILRDEWGFEGFALSDWFAVTGTASAVAGLDLEMPGPSRHFGAALAAAVRSGELDETQLDTQVTHLLSVFERLDVFDELGDPVDVESVDDEADRALTREAAAAAIVLLTNDGVLPLDRSALQRVAVIGPCADRTVIMGGGSASVTPAYRVTPLDALRTALGPDVDVVYAPGVDIERAVPTMKIDLAIEYHGENDLDGPAVEIGSSSSGEIFFLGAPPGVAAPFSYVATGTYEVATSGRYVLSLVQAGRARLLVDGSVVIDGIADPPPRNPDAYFGFGSEERHAELDLEAGRPVEIRVEYVSGRTSGVYAAKVGCRALPVGDLMAQAVEAATGADVAIVVAGTTSEWESEGFDRPTMDLPRDQDELITRVAAANPNTIVAVNTGAPVSMPWVDAVRAVAQIWYGGQEMANALADVVVGVSEPGGRMPTTIPLRVEHNPSFGNFPGEYDEVRYGEGLLVGYRWYEARHLPVRFPFGHGLSYSRFTIGEPRLSAVTFESGTFEPGTQLTVEVPVENIGDRSGSEVVQCYVAPIAPRVTRPAKELKAFAKVRLDAGGRAVATLTLDDRSFAYWDPGSGQRGELRARMPFSNMTAKSDPRPGGWRVDPGPYTLHIGRSSADIAHVVTVTVGEHPS